MCGALICAQKRAGLCSGEICHAECLERAYGAREAIAGRYGAGESGEIADMAGEILHRIDGSHFGKHVSHMCRSGVTSQC